MRTRSTLFAHGSPAMPMMVDSYERAMKRALADATRRQEPQAILVVDLEHPEQAVEILGYVYPDGSYREVAA